MRQKCSMVAAVLAAGLLGSVQAQGVRDEGTGSRRSALDAMIYKAAPMDAVLAGTEWVGQQPSAADLNGKVVMVFTFAEWYKPSNTAAMLAKRLLEQHAGDGLVVIGVHDKNGWDEVASFAEKRKLEFPIVRDADGKIRETLMVDQDPDIYVIDRAGNMRYADITTETATEAVETLLAEDSDSAAGALGLRDQARARQRAEERRSGAINQNVTLENLPVIPFTKPSPEAYASVNWPKIEKELLENAQSYDELTPPFAVPDGEWLNGKPNIDGKIIVAYLWHPAEKESMSEMMLKMEDLHKQQGRDIAVMGFMIPHAENGRSRDRGGLIGDKFLDIPITLDGMKSALGNRRITHSLLATPGSPLPQIGTRRQSRDSDTFGRIVIVSTDGRVRREALWLEWSKVQQAIDHLLRVDPGVKARREAEERYIRGSGG
ncbi:MAG: TlpA family protein disulfide reductase [Phycisphaerales bacterium]|nr:TlpA family protein disulfide reductase [Phycisphaerales bacterium]MCB9837055.1 TlpA family protein disulfide reductase [Phycisphaera sp.]